MVLYSSTMDSHLAAVAVSVDDRVYAEVLYCKECYS